MPRKKNAATIAANNNGNLTAVIFQTGETKTADKAGKELVFIHSGNLTAKEVKKNANVFLAGLLTAFFTPTQVVVNAGQANQYTIAGQAKTATLKDIRVSFQFNGKQVYITNKARLTSCIGKGINSLNFGKLVSQLLGLIAEVTEDKELLNSIAVMFKAAGKTDKDIAALKDEAKIEISKTGVKLASKVISEVRKEVKENSMYGVYLTGLADSRKLLKAAETKAALQAAK